jgi:hypothetical protein
LTDLPPGARLTTPEETERILEVARKLEDDTLDPATDLAHAYLGISRTSANDYWTGKAPGSIGAADIEKAIQAAVDAIVSASEPAIHILHPDNFDRYIEAGLCTTEEADRLMPDWRERVAARKLR